MARTKALVSILSVGLAVGCGDDGMPSTTAATGQTTMTGVTTVDTTMGTTADMTASSTQPTSTTEGSGSMTSASSGTTDEPTTGMITATMSTSSTMGTTDVMMTTDVSSTSSGSTSTDGTSTSTSTSTSSSTTDDTTSSSGSTSSTSTTNDVSSTTEDIPCDEQQVVLQPVTPNVMLVLDKSESMINNKWDHDQNVNTPTVTRWYSLWAVVDQILTSFQADFNFGMKLFPGKNANNDYDASACTTPGNVEVTVQPFAKNVIMNTLPAQNSMAIQGGTPAADGMVSALNHLNTLDPLVPRAVLLVTDGAANCGDAPLNLFEDYDQALHTVVANAYNNDGIPTYVIGIAIANADSGDAVDGNPDNINPYDKLNMLATEGGTAKVGPEKFYSADNQNELAAALNAIISDAQSCVIALDPEPGFPDFTKVKIGNNYLNKINDCANENGWKYVEPAPPFNAIELCGTACDALKMTGEAGVEYYCMPG